MKNTLIASSVLALALTSAVAQDAKQADASKQNGFFRNWSVGANAGVMLFYGDVKQYDYYPVFRYNSEYSLGYGLTLTKTLNSVIGLQGQILNGKLAGTSRYAKAASFRDPKDNRYFTANVFEYDFNVVINLSNLILSKRKINERKFSVYTTFGAGLTNFNTELRKLSDDALITEYGSSNPNSSEKLIFKNRTTEIVIPVSLGVKYKLNTKFDLGLETSVRFANTDKLDATAANNNKDSYQYTDFVVTYKFDNTDNDVEWVNPLDALSAKQDSLAAKVNGLTSDQDKDGVSDLFDKDNNTVEGSKVYGDGTAIDTDGDGVFDAQDADPFSAKGAKVDSKGRELDSDNDGVADSRDLEPNTASGALVNFQGKTINVSRNTSNESVAGAYLPSVYFASNSSNVQYKYYENLAAVARMLKANPSVKLTIIGNTDNKGSESANDKLGLKRAKSVVENLVNVYGIDSSRLTADTKGKREVLSSKADGVNRRVDFIVTK